MLELLKRVEFKWLLLGLLAGTAIGYLQGAGAVDLRALLPF